MFLFLVATTIWFSLEFLLLSVNWVSKMRLIVFLIVCICVCVCACRCSWRPEEGVRSLGAGVRAGPSVRVLHALNCSSSYPLAFLLVGILNAMVWLRIGQEYL